MLKKYMYVVAIFIVVSIILGVSYSNFIVTSNNHKAAEMYIGELKYSVEIDGSLNTLTVPKGETVVDVRVSNLNPVDTYYKLLYLKNSNITIKYYESTKDTDEVVTTYSKPNDSIKGDNSNYIKLIITNSSTTTQNVALAMKGGYITNTIDDIIVPSIYSDITEIESTKTNTYFCKTNDTLTQGLKYVNGQFTYAYKQQGVSSTSGLGWTNINSNGWGVQLTDSSSTDAVTSKFCTYINNKPTTSTVMMFYNSKAGSIDFTGFDTSKITNMASMFYGTQTPVLDVSNFDTSEVTNMYCMFYKTIVTTLDVSNFDTSKVYNMRYMFGESKVTILDLRNFDTSKVTSMKSMFYKSNVTTLDLSNFNTTKVTDMSYMFYSVPATTLDVSNFDTSKVTNMSYMFYSVPATTLDVSNFDTSKVTDMSYMFYSVPATTLDVSNFNTSNVTNMKDMFNRTKATTLDVSNFDTSKVTNMSYMFYSVPATTLDVSNFDTSKVTDMSYMFYSVPATTLDVSNFNTSNVTNMKDMFNRTKATTLDVSNFDTSKVTDMSRIFTDTQAITLNVSNFDTSNVTNMSCMFCGSKVTSLDLSNFDTSNVTNMRDMFNKTKATTLDVSNFDTSKVTNMSFMFYGTNVTTLDLSNFNTSNVTNMWEMFRESSVTALNLTNFDTSKVTNMSSMFGELNLNALNLSNFDTSNVTDMSFMFINSKIANLNVSSFNTSKVTNMRCMFCSFKSATLDVSNFDTSKVTNMSDMFSTSTLNTIYVSNKFDTSSVINTTDTLDGSTNMFRGCTNLVGGSGTKYNSSYTDKTYARIDGGTSSPGYFTDIADKDIPAPSSFATDSWATIAHAVRKNNLSAYKVGDTRSINLGGSYNYHTLRIANTSTPSECSTSGFSQSSCGFVVEFADIITQMDPGSLKVFDLSSLYNQLPTDLKEVIIDTSVVTSLNGTNNTSTQKLYILAPKEVYSNFSYTIDASRNYVRQLDYYSSKGVTTSNYSAAIKNYDGTASIWWLRTAGVMNTFTVFYLVQANGNVSYIRTTSNGISPAFRIG